MLHQEIVQKLPESTKDVPKMCQKCAKIRNYSYSGFTAKDFVRIGVYSDRPLAPIIV